MTTVVLNRRNLLAAGGSVLATGVSGLLLPARAQGLAPTVYHVGRGEQLPQGRAGRGPDRQGWLLDERHRAPRRRRGLRLPGSASKFGRTRPKGRAALGLHLKLQPTRSDLVGLRPMARQAAARGRLCAGGLAGVLWPALPARCTASAVACP